MFVVLSPIWNVILEGMIVPLCAKFPSGVFSEADSDSDPVPGDSRLCWYWMFKFVSLLASWSQMSLGVSAACWSSFLSRQKDLILLYVRLCFFGLVTMFDSSVFGGRPKCASNGVIFVTRLGISLIDSIIADIFSAMVVLFQIGSDIIEASLRLRVCISLSTMPVALWSLVGENNS